MASQADLTTRVPYENRAGLDEKYLLPNMRWPVGNATPSVTTATNRFDTAGGLYAAKGMPHHIGLFTHMFSCNMTERLGGVDWYNKSIKEQWEAARAAGRGDPLPSADGGRSCRQWSDTVDGGIEKPL